MSNKKCTRQSDSKSPTNCMCKSVNNNTLRTKLNQFGSHWRMVGCHLTICATVFGLDLRSHHECMHNGTFVMSLWICLVKPDLQNFLFDIPSCLHLDKTCPIFPYCLTCWISVNANYSLCVLYRDADSKSRMVLQVDPFLSVSAAHDIGEAVRHQIHKHHSQVAEVFIHIGT